jgi:hypothetical protein
MSRIIPNENSWIGFTTVRPADLAAPTVAELAGATNLTSYIVSINPTAQGNAIPTPALDSLFDRSAIGTSQGSFTADMYRDDEGDLAWDTLPRGVRGYFFISRFGGSGVDHIPAEGEPVEVWPVAITQRAGSAMSSNTVQTFTVSAAVPDPPEEDAIVSATSGVPTAPKNLVATAGATGLVTLDWDVPDFVGAGITGYKVYKSTVAGGAGAYTEVTTNITKIGTVANLTAVTAGLTYFKVLATNAAGDGPQSAFASCTVV